MAGLDAGSRDSLTDGRLALYVMNAGQRRSLVLMGWRVLLFGADRVQELELFHVEEAVIETRRRVAVALDGEVVYLEPPLTYRIRPPALAALPP